MADRGLSLRLVGWFLVGCAFGLAVQALQLAPRSFDLAVPLRVGDSSAALPVIVSDLGRVPVTRGQGHDGQYYYLIARDPLGLRGYPDLTDDGGYRFRRPLSGWLAGGLGLLGPEAILWGLTVWEIVGLGLTTAALAHLLRRRDGRSWGMVGALANLGLWLSIQLDTPDALALGLSLVGVAAILRRRVGWAVLALSAAALTKDPYLLFALGTGGWLWTQGRRKHAAAVAVVPALIVGLWAAWLTAVGTNGFSTKGNFGLPFMGLVEGAWEWTHPPGGQVVLGLAAVLTLVVAGIGFLRTQDLLLRWLIGPWLIAAITAAETVWVGGNNALRVFAPLWLLGWLALATTRAFGAGQQPVQTTSRRNLPV